MRFPFQRRKGEDTAASPVIGVILMVGSTVVLAATVYAWSSSYANVPDQAVKVIALTPSQERDGAYEFTVASVMPGLRYADLNFTLDHQPLPLVTDGGCAAPPPEGYRACVGDRVLLPRDVVEAGDTLRLRGEAGQTLRVIDSAAGMVVLIVTLG